MSVKIAIKTVFFAVLLYSMFTLPVLAAESADVGIQPYYAHPLTGVVEDAGDNPAIGQGMVESVLSPGGFYEVDNDGNQWLTLRLNLADHTKNASFAVQTRGSSGFTAVQAMEVQRSGNSVDYMIPVPAADAILRIQIFVVDMGRDVIFYGLMDGQLNNRQSDGATPAVTSAGGLGSTAGGGTGTVPPNAKKSGLTANKGPAGKASAGVQPPAKDMKDTGAGDDFGLLTADSPQLQKDKANNGTWGLVSRILFAALVITLVLITVGAVLGVAVLFFSVRFLRRYNDGKEALLYDAEDRLG